MDSSPVDIYCHHLRDMISTAATAGQPSAVLWGDKATTENDVSDFLSVVSTGLVPAAHVVGVDRLTPRIREQLLRLLQRGRVCSPLMFIFGKQDGADVFAQYKVEQVPPLDQPSAYAKTLWLAGKATPAAPPNAAIWVVTGNAGSGKTRWIQDNVREEGDDQTLNFVVHEGFSPLMVINRLEKQMGAVEKVVGAGIGAVAGGASGAVGGGRRRCASVADTDSDTGGTSSVVTEYASQ